MKPTRFSQDNFRRLHNACCESRKTNSVVLRFSLDEFCSARRFSQDNLRRLHNACCESRKKECVGYIMCAASLALQNSSSENCWGTRVANTRCAGWPPKSPFPGREDCVPNLWSPLEPYIVNAVREKMEQCKFHHPATIKIATETNQKRS